VVSDGTAQYHLHTTLSHPGRWIGVTNGITAQGYCLFHAVEIRWAAPRGPFASIQKIHVENFIMETAFPVVAYTCH